jgi:hypothetical protein
VVGKCDPLDKVARKAVEFAARARLGDEVESAFGERIDGPRSGGRRERRHDDDRDIQRAGVQRAQHTDAVSAGHREVQRKDVGRQLLTELECLVTVGGDADHIDTGALELGREHAAHQRRVVGDHNPGCGRRRHRLRLRLPAQSSRRCSGSRAGRSAAHRP